MKKIFYLVALVAISLLFVQCEQQSGSNMSKYDVGTGEENGHAYVDLGLSVKWATCDVGAKYAFDKGDYFAWGEVYPKETYDWNTYEHSALVEDDNAIYRKIIKYCIYCENNHSRCDGKSVLDECDDVAAVMWGGTWRMPTEDEVIELLERCEWRYVLSNGENAFEVIGPNGNSIHLYVARYWTSELNTSMMIYSRKAMRLRVCHGYDRYGDFVSDSGLGSDMRYEGFMVRPVCK